MQTRRVVALDDELAAYSSCRADDFAARFGRRLEVALLVIEVELRHASAQKKHCEPGFVLHPRTHQLPSAVVCARDEIVKPVFVRALGVNGFAGAESELAARDRHRLVALGNEVHLDALVARVPDRTVRKCAQVEIGAKGRG